MTKLNIWKHISVLVWMWTDSSKDLFSSNINLELFEWTILSISTSALLKNHLMTASEGMQVLQVDDHSPNISLIGILNLEK